MDERKDSEPFGGVRTNSQNHSFMLYLTRLAPWRRFLIINVILVAIGIATITLLYIQITK